MGTVSSIENNRDPHKRGPKGPWKYKHNAPSGDGAGATNSNTGSGETQGIGNEQIPQSNLVDPGDPQHVEINFNPAQPGAVPQIKPAKKTKAAAKKTDLTPEHLGELLMMAMDLVATRAGEHWKITQQEALNVAKPLARILERMNLADKIAKMGDGAALLLAVGAIVYPRVIMQMMVNKMKKTEGKEERQHEQKRADQSSTGKPDEPTPAAGATSHTGGFKARLQDVIPSVA